MKEQRKLWLFGLSPGNWITITIFIIGLAGAGVGGIVNYARAVDKIEANQEEIKKVKEDVNIKIEKVNEDLRRQINESELRTRSDIKELRQIIVNGR